MERTWCQKRQRAMSYLMQKPRLQLDKYEILSIEILFHTQHHIDKSTKELSNPQRDKESMPPSRQEKFRVKKLCNSLSAWVVTTS